jgi:hypothetical protein
MFCTVAQIIALYRNWLELPPLASSNKALMEEYQPRGKGELQELVFRNIVFGHN